MVDFIGSSQGYPRCLSEKICKRMKALDSSRFYNLKNETLLGYSEK